MRVIARWEIARLNWQQNTHNDTRIIIMSAGKDEFDQHLPVEDINEKVFVEVPSSLPALHRRFPSLLNRPYRNIGVGSQPVEEPMGLVWQMWVVVGFAIALMLPVVLTVLAAGDWFLVGVMMPIVGLLFVAIARTFLAEWAVA